MLLCKAEKREKESGMVGIGKRKRTRRWRLRLCIKKKIKIEQVNVFLNGGCVRMCKIIKISTTILKCNDDLYPLEKWGCSSFAENKASSTPKFKYALS